MGLRQACALDQVVQLPDGGVPRELRDIGIEVVLLLLRELPLLIVLQGLVPVGSNADPGDLRRVGDLPAPRYRSILGG